MFNDVKTWDVLPLNETKANTNLCFIAHLLSPSQVPGVSDEVYPPLELVATEAVANVDMPVVIGTVILAAVFIIITNIIVDLFYAFLDPKVRLN